MILQDLSVDQISYLQPKFIHAHLSPCKTACKHWNSTLYCLKLWPGRKPFCDHLLSDSTRTSLTGTWCLHMVRMVQFVRQGGSHQIHTGSMPCTRKKSRYNKIRPHCSLRDRTITYWIEAWIAEIPQKPWIAEFLWKLQPKTRNRELKSSYCAIKPD